MANATGTPPAEVEIDEALVRDLLADQHPDLAGLPIRHVDSGWDNAMFRLGEELCLRLPRRTVAARLILNEQRWLPLLAPRLPLPIPAPVRIGAPGAGYPWSWSVIAWMEGRTADLDPPGADQAEPLAAFLRALHVAAPADAPPNPVRGVPLEGRIEAVEERLARLKRITSAITPRVRRAWREALEAPHERSPTWLHGDLHARNVLVRSGRLTGIIDWGDMTSGDRATDLAALWMLLPDAGARARATEAYGDPDSALWLRARGWAILFATFLLDTGLQDHPQHAAMGRLTFERLAAAED